MFCSFSGISEQYVRFTTIGEPALLVHRATTRGNRGESTIECSCLASVFSVVAYNSIESTVTRRLYPGPKLASDEAYRSRTKRGHVQQSSDGRYHIYRW